MTSNGPTAADPAEGDAVRWASIVPVWALAALGAGAVFALRPDDGVLTWFPIVLALSTIAAFLVQLAVRPRRGLVTRVMASVSGAVVVLAAATVIAVATA